MISDNINIKNVALYTRVSTDEQVREGFSLEAQLKRLRAHCIGQQWTIVNEYVDDGYTGRNIKRPQYQQMIQDLDQFDGIIVLKMDRIHRSQKNFTKMMEYLQKHDKDFISATENFDTTTAIGRFVMDIIQRIAQLESEQDGERVTYSNGSKSSRSYQIL